MEQVAYCPAIVVPGMDFSNDLLLLRRLFSYLDAHLSRLDSPNFHQIPINAPKGPFSNQRRDGYMQRKDTLTERTIGILIAESSDGAVIEMIIKAATDADAKVKIVPQKVRGAKLVDGSILAVDKQLAGMPSALLDAVAFVLSGEGAKVLSKESAAVDFVRDAFNHLKAIAVDESGKAFLKQRMPGRTQGLWI